MDARDGARGTAKADRIATVSLFLAFLWLPLCVSLATPDARVSLSEQRSLASLPPLGAPGWPAAFERYYDDRIGLRDPAIRAWAWLHVAGLGVSPSQSLLVGREGWFFFGDEAAVAQYRGSARFDDAALRRWSRVLEERRRWLAERGVGYLLVLVPNKHRMYARHMPASIPRSGETSQLDQLVDHLGAHSGVAVLDLRPTLEAAAAGQRVYHRTDTHWNDVGAYAAYRAILEALAPQVPSLAGREPVAVRPLVRTTPGLGLVRMLGLAAAYPEESLELRIESPRAEPPKHRRAELEERVERQLPFALGTGDPSLPSAVMFRDSFANALVPYLSESFSRIVYVWERDVVPDVVEAERPDVVIQEIAERFLGRAPLSIEAARRSAQVPARSSAGS